MANLEKIGLNIFINGVAQFSRDVGYIVSGYLRYEKALASLERRATTLGNAEMRLANTQLALAEKAVAAGGSYDLVATAMQNQKDAGEKLQSNLNAIKGAMGGLGGFLNVLTGGFGQSIVLTSGLADKLAMTAPQIAAVSLALNVLKIGLDVFVYTSRLVIRVLETLWQAFSKVVTWVWNLGVKVGSFLVQQLWKLVSFPFKLIQAGFNAIGNALGGIVQVFTGVSLANAIWNIAMQIRNFGKDLLDTAMDFQLLRIQLQGLVAQEMVNNDSTLSFANAMDMAKGKSQELFTWIAKLAIQSPLTVQGVNEMLFMAVAYGNTTAQAKLLTDATVKYASAINLTNDKAQNIILNIGQMRTAGKVTGIAIRNMARDMVPVGKILGLMGEKFGLTKIQAQKMAATGTYLGKELKDLTDEDLTPLDAALSGLPVEEFQQTFIDFVNANYPGVLGRMSVSLQVATENAKDLFNVLFSMDLLGPIFDVLGTHLNNFIQLGFSDETRASFQSFGKSIAGFLETMMTTIDTFTQPFIKSFLKMFEKPSAKIKWYGGLLKDWLHGQLNWTYSIQDSNKAFWNLLKALNKIPLTGYIKQLIGMTDAGETLNGALTRMSVSADDGQRMFAKLGLAMYDMWKKGDIIGFLKATGDMLRDEVIPAFKQFYNDVIAPWIAQVKDTVFKWIQDQANNLLGWLDTNAPRIVTWLTDNISKAFDTLVSHIGGAKTTIGGLMEDIKGVITAVMQNIGADVSNMPQPIMEGAKGGTIFSKGNAQTFLGNAGAPAGPTQNNVFMAIKKLADDAKVAVTDLIKSGLQALSNYFNTKWKEMITNIELLTKQDIQNLSDFFTVFKNLPTLGENTTKTIDIIFKLSEAFKNFTQPIRDIVLGSAGIALKLTTMYQAVSGFLKSFSSDETTGFLSKVQIFSANMVTISQNFATTWNNFKGIIGEGAKNIWDQIVNAFAIDPNADPGKQIDLIGNTYTAIGTKITDASPGILAANQGITDGIANGWRSLGADLVYHSYIPQLMIDINNAIVNGMITIIQSLPPLLDAITVMFADQTFMWNNSFDSTTKAVGRLIGAIQSLKKEMEGLNIGGGGGGTSAAKGLVSKSQFDQTASQYGPKASGGHLNSGIPYIVGEKGIELFMPKYPGFLVPTSQVLQALQMASVSVNTPVLGRNSYTNASTQMNFYGPQYFSVPSNMDMVTLFRGAKS